MRHRAEGKDHGWSCNFLTDRAEDGRPLRLPAVIDEYTRECLAIEVGRSFTPHDVIGVLPYPFALRGAPQHIRSDNDLEFVVAPILSAFPAGSRSPLSHRPSDYVDREPRRAVRACAGATTLVRRPTVRD